MNDFYKQFIDNPDLVVEVNLSPDSWLYQRLSNYDDFDMYYDPDRPLKIQRNNRYKHALVLDILAWQYGCVNYGTEDEGYFSDYTEYKSIGIDFETLETLEQVLLTEIEKQSNN